MGYNRPFAVRLREARSKAKITQRELAESIGMSRSYVAGIEGGYWLPSRVLATAIATRLQVDPQWLIGKEKYVFQGRS